MNSTSTACAMDLNEMMALQVEWLSDRGGRSYNEDACGHCRSANQLCAVLADGAGGHGGGDIASRLAVRELVTLFAQQQTSTADELALRLRAVNETLIAERQPGTAQQDMHSTVVCLVIDVEGGHAHWAHAGDSRLYWFRGGKLMQRTRDHSLVQSLVDAGMLTPERLADHPQRSELRSALGVAPEVLEVAAADGQQGVEPGDVFLLCTDGLWEYVSDGAMAAMLLDAGDARAWLNALADGVRGAAHRKANHDNFTALAVWADAGPDAVEVS
jgi:PPM family protein phosphatase